MATDDPLSLTELFQGGGEPWLPLLKPAIEELAEAAARTSTSWRRGTRPKVASVAHDAGGLCR